MRDLPDLKLPNVGEKAVAIERPAKDRHERPRRMVMEASCSYTAMPYAGSCSATLAYPQARLEEMINAAALARRAQASVRIYGDGGGGQQGDPLTAGLTGGLGGIALDALGMNLLTNR